MSKQKIDNDAVFNSMEFGLGDNAVLHTETTGLIPFAPENEALLRSYKEIDKYRQQPIAPKK